MSARDFFLDASRKRVATSIEKVEKETAAEVVVAVRKRCASYRVVDVAAGTFVAFAALVAIVFLPQEFATDKIPGDVAIAFWVTYGLTANITTLKRLLTPPSLKTAHVRVAARAAFHDMKIARTRGRTGVLVFVSVFERKVEIVTDTGVPVETLGPDWSAALGALASSAGAADFDRFLAAIESMAPPLARALPIQEDDVDELPNEPEVA